MMVDQILTFRRIFFKKLQYIQLFTFDMKGQGGSGSGTLLQLPLPRKFVAYPASSFHFHTPGLKAFRQN